MCIFVWGTNANINTSMRDCRHNEFATVLVSKRPCSNSKISLQQRWHTGMYVTFLARGLKAPSGDRFSWWCFLTQRLCRQTRLLIMSFLHLSVFVVKVWGDTCLPVCCLCVSVEMFNVEFRKMCFFNAWPVPKPQWNAVLVKGVKSSLLFCNK